MDKLSEGDVKNNDRVYNMMTSRDNPNFWFGSHKEDNYRRLLKIAQFSKTTFEGKACLDVGCGTGDFSVFLREQGIEEYLGIDIYEPSLEKAKAKHRSEKFLKMDILEQSPGKFDFVFCSGALSTRLETDNYKFIEAMIRRMWDCAKVGVAFNFLVGIANDSDIYHYSYNVVEGMCKKIMGKEGILNSLRHDIDEAHIYLARVI